MKNSKNKPVIASPEDLKLFEKHYCSAIDDKDIKPLQAFVTSYPQFIDVIPNRPLWAAVCCNDLDFATWLIDQGADVNYADSYHQYTILHEDFSHGRDISLPMFKLLLAKGAKTDVFCKGSNWGEDRLTPLHLAAMYNRLDLVIALLQADALPHLTTGGRHSNTALGLCINKGNNITIIQELINAKANPNSINGLGQPQLVKLLKCGFLYKPVELLLKAVKILMKAGAALNLSDNEGLTPLHVCAQNGYSEIAEYLIQNGANPELKDAKGHDFKWHAEHGNMLSLDQSEPEVKRVISRMNAQNSYQITEEGYFVAPKDKDSKTVSPIVMVESGEKGDQYVERWISSSLDEYVKNRAAVLPIWEKRNELKLNQEISTKIEPETSYQIIEDYKQINSWATLFPLPKGLKPFVMGGNGAEEDDDEIGLDIVLNQRQL